MEEGGVVDKSRVVSTMRGMWVEYLYGKYCEVGCGWGLVMSSVL